MAMTETNILERAPQLDEFGERFASASSVRDQVILLGGKAGSGKSSVVGAFIDSLPGDVVVRLASCDAAGIPRPLGPIFDIAGTFGP
jgi:hypothetical protein